MSHVPVKDHDTLQVEIFTFFGIITCSEVSALSRNDDTLVRSRIIDNLVRIHRVFRFHLNRFNPQHGVPFDLQSLVGFLGENLPVLVRHGQKEALREYRRRNHHPEFNRVFGFLFQFGFVSVQCNGRSGCLRHLNDRKLTDDRRHGSFSRQAFSIPTLELDGFNGNATAIELEHQIAAHILEPQQVILSVRGGNHGICSKSIGVFPVGLFLGERQCQDTRIIQSRGLLIGIDGTY